MPAVGGTKQVREVLGAMRQKAASLQRVQFRRSWITVFHAVNIGSPLARYKRSNLTPYIRKAHPFRDLSPAAAECVTRVRSRRPPFVFQGRGGRAAHHAGRGEPPGEGARGVPRRGVVPPRRPRRDADRRGARLPAAAARGLRCARRRGGDDPREGRRGGAGDHRAAGVHRALADAAPRGFFQARAEDRAARVRFQQDGRRRRARFDRAGGDLDLREDRRR